MRLLHLHRIYYPRTYFYFRRVTIEGIQFFREYGDLFSILFSGFYRYQRRDDKNLIYFILIEY